MNGGDNQCQTEMEKALEEEEAENQEEEKEIVNKF